MNKKLVAAKRAQGFAQWKRFSLHTADRVCGGRATDIKIISLSTCFIVEWKCACGRLGKSGYGFAEEVFQ